MSHSDNFKHAVKTEEELRSIIGLPSELATKKVINHLDNHCLDFISQSPFFVLATSDDSGFCDVSPRGDKPGFVQVLDNKRLVIPERPGNKRIDSMRNILSNPRVGLLFFIPRLGETLRVNGIATIIQDDDILEKMEVLGKKPLLGIVVEVEECFIHCAKAFKRSGLWQPDSWPCQDVLPSAAKILAEHAKLPNLNEKVIEKRLDEAYSKRLY